MISLLIPYHDTHKTAFFLGRIMDSINKQSYKDYEIILVKEGPFARNHNAAILKAKGDICQFIQMDDYLTHPDALQEIVTAFEQFPDRKWMISACLHNRDGEEGWAHIPRWSDDIWTGNNTLGSVSTLAFRSENALFFEEPLTWLVDCDLYYRLYLKYGLPILGEHPNVVIDVRTDRLTHTLSEELKTEEIDYLQKKYGK